MVITPTAYDRPGLFDTVWRFHGEDEQGRRVTFGVDHRIARELASYLDHGEDLPAVWVEAWQVLSTAQ